MEAHAARRRPPGRGPPTGAARRRPVLAAAALLAGLVAPALGARTSSPPGARRGAALSVVGTGEAMSRARVRYAAAMLRGVGGPPTAAAGVAALCALGCSAESVTADEVLLHDIVDACEGAASSAPAEGVFGVLGKVAGNPSAAPEVLGRVVALLRFGLVTDAAPPVSASTAIAACKALAAAARSLHASADLLVMIVNMAEAVASLPSSSPTVRRSALDAINAVVWGPSADARVLRHAAAACREACRRAGGDGSASAAIRTLSVVALRPAAGAEAAAEVVGGLVAAGRRGLWKLGMLLQRQDISKDLLREVVDGVQVMFDRYRSVFGEVLHAVVPGAELQGDLPERALAVIAALPEVEREAFIELEESDRVAFDVIASASRHPAADAALLHRILDRVEAATDVPAMRIVRVNALSAISAVAVSPVATLAHARRCLRLWDALRKSHRRAALSPALRFAQVTFQFDEALGNALAAVARSPAADEDLLEQVLGAVADRVSDAAESLFDMSSEALQVLEALAEHANASIGLLRRVVAFAEAIATGCLPDDEDCAGAARRAHLALVWRLSAPTRGNTETRAAFASYALLAGQRHDPEGEFMGAACPALLGALAATPWPSVWVGRPEGLPEDVAPALRSFLAEPGASIICQAAVRACGELPAAVGASFAGEMWQAICADDPTVRWQAAWQSAALAASADALSDRELHSVARCLLMWPDDAKRSLVLSAVVAALNATAVHLRQQRPGGAAPATRAALCEALQALAAWAAWPSEAALLAGIGAPCRPAA